MSSYRINDFEFSADAPNFQTILERAHSQKLRPSCLCCPAHPKMYVALIGGEYYLKRMPGTGHAHDPGCASFDPPPELSGLGHVAGAAIVTDDAGDTTLRLDFSLSMRGGSSVSPAPGGDTETTSVVANPKKLSLLGTLHYLWDAAGLTKWRPQWQRRNWWIIHRELTGVAQNTGTKAQPFASVLMVPPVYNHERRDELALERRSWLRGLAPQRGKPVPLGIVVAEFKLIEPSQYGRKLKMKHLPDFAFFMDDDLAARFDRLFADKIHAIEAAGDGHLILIATFSIRNNYAEIREIAGMTVNEHWIPFDGDREHQLVEALKDRAYAKSLKYNLQSSAPVANALLLDTGAPIALYVPPDGLSADDEETLHDIAEDGVYQPWFWPADEIEMPALPAPAGGGH